MGNNIIDLWVFSLFFSSEDLILRNWLKKVVKINFSVSHLHQEMEKLKTNSWERATNKTTDRVQISNQNKDKRLLMDTNDVWFGEEQMNISSKSVYAYIWALVDHFPLAWIREKSKMNLNLSYQINFPRVVYC